MGDPGFFFGNLHLYPCLQVQVFMGMGAGLMGAHGFEGQP